MNLPPPNDVITKRYSLQPDMMMGWRPKARVVGPVPLNFDQPLVDQIVKNQTNRVIYLGLRPTDTFHMHRQFSKQYRFKYQHLYKNNFQHLKSFFRKFYANFQPKMKFPFTGMNPSLSHSIQFNSLYQSGNLDCVVKIKQNVYDLFMRIDSNTYGHNNWYNFKVKNIKRCKITFRIRNFRKSNSPYSDGMKPYVFSEKQKQLYGKQWNQDGCQISYQSKLPAYKCLQNCWVPSNLHTLTFQYIFKHQNDTVQFCYCVPYQYSKMLKLVENVCQLAGNDIVKESKLAQSLSGVDIPLLTITNFNLPKKGKKCILISARVHPGQSNGSYMIDGFLKWITSFNKEAAIIRNNFVIKIIPMINPDGVILGNFRSCCAGKDLNRVFNAKIDALYPQIVAQKALVKTLKKQFKNDLHMFLDFHGHSLKKNVFMYGPQYKIWNNNYYKSRIFPKMLYDHSEMINPSKQSTARAVFLKQIPFCYTVQASNYSYIGKLDKLEHLFKPVNWIQMGKNIAQTLSYYYQSQLHKESLRKKAISQTTKQKMLDYKQRAQTIQNNDLGPQDQGKSDSQNSDQDKTCKQIKKLHKQIILSLNQFSQIFGSPAPHKINQKDWQDQQQRPQTPIHVKQQGCKPIACLRCKSGMRLSQTRQFHKKSSKKKQVVFDLQKPASVKPPQTLFRFSQLNMQFSPIIRQRSPSPLKKKSQIIQNLTKQGVKLQKAKQLNKPVKLRYVNLISF